MHNFINTRHFSALELDTLLNCCDARAKKEGYISWTDPNLTSPIKRAIVLKCIEVCGFPVEVIESE
jgi:hypothetical protein